MQTIYLDISNKGVYPCIYAKQGDVGRKVEIVLTNSGLPYNPEAGSVFSAWYSGAGGAGNYTDIGSRSAFAVSGNKVTVELITQMLQNVGEGFLCLVLSRAGGDQIGMWNIRYICEGVPGSGSETAKDYYTAFSQAVTDLPYPDASLSVVGKAADAAATGEALDGKAPAGHGLGENIGKVAPSSNAGNYDANEIINSGWWRAKTNCPTNGWWSILHIAHTDDYSTQYAFSYFDISAETSGTVIKRYKYKGTWNPWEYANPPMEPGVEYRTIERFCDKPVYWKLVDVGALPNASSITVEHKIANIEYLVHKSLTAGCYHFPCHWGGNDIGDTEIYVNSNSIQVKTTTNWSSYNGYAFLKYAKTTD